MIGHVMLTAGAVDEVHDTQQMPLWTRAFDDAGIEYIYLEGVANVVVGSWVNMDVGTDGVVALVDTDVAATQIGRLAVAMAAIVADKYGWFAISGTPVPGKTLTGATDTKNGFATSTAGSLDDSGAGAEVLVFGAFMVGAVDETTLLSNYALNYPFMTGLTLD